MVEEIEPEKIDNHRATHKVQIERNVEEESKTPGSFISGTDSRPLTDNDPSEGKVMKQLTRGQRKNLKKKLKKQQEELERAQAE